MAVSHCEVKALPKGEKEFNGTMVEWKGGFQTENPEGASHLNS